MDTTTSFDLLAVLRVLWHRKGTIVLLGLLGAVLAVLFSTTLPRRYSAEGSVVVRAAALTSSDSDAAFGAGVVNEAVVTTEQDVLGAPGLLARVAAGVTIPPELLERRSLPERLAGWARDVAGLLGPRALAWTQARIAEWVPPQPEGPATEAERRLQFVQQAVSVGAAKNSSVIVVRALTADPRLSAATVNGVLDVYMDDQAAQQNRTAGVIQAALTERLRQTRQQIADGEARLAALMRRPDVIDNSEVPGEMRDVALVGAQLTQAQAELARRQAEFSGASQLRGARLSNAQNSGSIAELRRMLAEAQASYARVSSDLGPNHPNAQAAQRQIATLQGEIGAEASRGLDQRRADLAAAQATVDSLTRQLAELRARRQSATPQTLDLDRQKESLASLWRISEVLETRLIDMAARPTNLNARILSRAAVPTLAAFPNRGLFALGGFVLAAAAAAAMVLVRSHIYRLRPMASQLALQLNAPLLGGLPQVSGRRTQQRLVDSALHDRRASIINDTLSSVAIEVENVVRRGELRCLMIASAKSGEGKTTVAVALGRALAASGLRVLLVDLDLRRPSVERVLMSSGRRSLHDGVCTLGTQEIEIRVDEASGIHLFTPRMTPAAPDPIRLLRSKSLHGIVEQVRTLYDLVLFDTPPVMTVPDALLVATMTDALLLVTELGRSLEPEVEEFSRRLSRTGKPICGVVVTKVKTEDTYWEAY